MSHKTALQNRKQIWAWCSFDWANSAYPTMIVSFVFPAYFAKAIVKDEVIGQVYWTWTIGLSALCVALSAPWLGRLVDKYGALKKALIASASAAIAGSALLWFAVPSETAILYALIVVAFSNLAFELSSCLYNAVIPSLLPDRSRGRLSGLAWGFGYLGGLSVLVLALVLFIQPKNPLFGLSKDNAENVRAVFLLTSLWFLLFALPFFFILKSPPPSRRRKSPPLIFAQGKLSRTGRFLIARMLYTDAVTTIFAVGGLFAVAVHGFSLSQVLVFGVLMNVMAAFGAILGGFLEDRLGAIRLVKISLIALGFCGTALIFLPGKAMFWGFALSMGAFFGPLQSSSRVLLSRWIPPDAAAQAFGWYAASGKATAFIGPLLVGAATAVFASNRLGLLPILLLLLAGLLLMPDNDNAQNPAREKLIANK